MGEGFVNYQIKCDSIKDVSDKVRHLTITKAYVSPPKNGWITVYDRNSDSELQYNEIRHFAQKLSLELSTVDSFNEKYSDLEDAESFLLVSRTMGKGNKD